MSRARPTVPVEPTQAVSVASTTCSACGSPKVTRLTMTLSDGTPVDMVSCHACEHRTWRTSDGAVLTREEVLSRATKEK